MSGSDIISVALFHPKQAMVDALEMLLSPHPDIDVVAAHTDLDWIRHAVAAGHVNVLLLNIDDGTVDPATIKSLWASSDGLGLVATTDVDDTTLAPDAVRAGVRGWVGTEESTDQLLCVIRGVHRGETWIPPAVTTRLLESLLPAEESRQRASSALAALSNRELEVLHCLTQGLTRREIAVRLVLSPHTVRTHINNVLRKLEVHSALAAVSIARQAGLDSQRNGQARRI